MNPQTTAAVTSPASGTRSIRDDDAIDELLDALDDPDSRAILEATVAETLTASELADACGLPLSTTYRKVDSLTDVGLLREDLRLSSSGKHTNEYSANVESIELSIDEEDGLVVEISIPPEDVPSDGLLAGAD